MNSFRLKSRRRKPQKLRHDKLLEMKAQVSIRKGNWGLVFIIMFRPSDAQVTNNHLFCIKSLKYLICILVLPRVTCSHLCLLEEWGRKRS